MARVDFSIPYTNSRKFPFRWLTLFVAIEFIVALFLFSLVNIGSVGYDLVTVYSSDPNAIISQADTSSIPAFLRSKSRPSCESANLEIGGTFSTNNSVLTYTLNAVDDGERKTAASLVYYNEMLDNCTVDNVLINIESTSRTMAQQAIIRYGVDLSAHIACTIASRDGPSVALNLTATYNYIPSTVDIYDGFTAFPGRNATTVASLYWAEASLINYCFFETLYRLAIADENGVDRGASYANPHSEDVADVINSLPFYTSADALAKSFYSTIFTDLGQVYKPNIFADAQLLNFFSSNFTRINKTADNFESRIPATPVESYDSLKSTSGPLDVNSSVISARYFCQVPRRKTTANFLISILVADLVLLQTLWVITIFIATYFVGQKDERASWCEGCSGVATAIVVSEFDKDRDGFTRQRVFRKRISAITLTQLHDSAESLILSRR